METDSQNKPIDLETAKTENNKKRLLEALEKSLGIVSKACKRTRLSRTQFYKWIHTDAEFKAAYDDIKENQKDFVEDKLLSNIRGGDTTAIIFYLKTQCKDRGYSEKNDLLQNFENAVSGITVTIKENHD